ncbi:MAG: hypothetical protein A2787_03310 [Omnitrophica WOR_2 bacterium RIFCSPHIGHO2_01_FULL_48_9]|nr:MAG: hypothetical protein A2787_03310 [Omnitrophica WOR_2 bacterium RIFCSPHIGHO2_01_FULL_48_9]
MVPYDATLYDEKKQKKIPDVLSDTLREQLLQYAKDFKTSWVNLGQHLYSVWRDKLYYTWGYEKFEDYTQEELGMQKPLAIKLLKTYFFLEQEEPAYLKEEFAQTRSPVAVPGYEAVNFLRLAKNNKELNKSDYIKFKKDIFENGKDVDLIRKDLVALMKERKVVDPEEERDKRSELTVRKLLNAIRSFQKDAESLKLLPADLIKEATGLMKKLEEQIA